MKQLRYGERTWLVGDGIADALLDHAAALARVEQAEHIGINVLDINGTPEHIEFLLGPATMMTAEPVAEEFEDPDNTDLERLMRLRTTDLNESPKKRA
jgi:hypothetical protein